jgi:hypothetical protein
LTAQGATFATEIPGPFPPVTFRMPIALNDSSRLQMLALSQGNTVVIYNNPASASCPYLAAISVLTQ